MSAAEMPRTTLSLFVFLFFFIIFFFYLLFPPVDKYLDK